MQINIFFSTIQQLQIPQQKQRNSNPPKLNE